jgi:hypothetical protein
LDVLNVSWSALDSALGSRWGLRSSMEIAGGLLPGSVQLLSAAPNRWRRFPKFRRRSRDIGFGAVAGNALRGAGGGRDAAVHRESREPSAISTKSDQILAAYVRGQSEPLRHP